MDQFFNSDSDVFVSRVRADTSPVLLLFASTSGQPLAINQAARDFINSGVLQSWQQLVDEPDLIRWQGIIHDAVRERVHFSKSTRLRRFDNAIRNFILRGEMRYTADGELAGYIIAGMDVTELTPEDKSEVAEQPSVTHDAQQWHDDLVSVSTVIRAYVDVLPDLFDQGNEQKVQEVIRHLTQAATQLSDSVRELSSIARCSTEA